MEQQQISITEVNARLQALQAQRNDAFDRVAVLAGQLAAEQERSRALAVQVKALQELAEKAPPVV